LALRCPALARYGFGYTTDKHMDNLTTHLPEIITAAAQSYLGTLALLSVALSVLAYFFFAKASEKARIGIFVLLFLGVLGFGAAMFRVSANAAIAPKPADTTITLSDESKQLLKAASQDPSGLILYEKYGASVDLHSNDKSFLTRKDDHRLLAQWESALQDLINSGLITMRGDSGEIYEITKKGYDTAAHID
jgi:hypothetical protein